MISLLQPPPLPPGSAAVPSCRAVECTGRFYDEDTLYRLATMLGWSACLLVIAASLAVQSGRVEQRLSLQLPCIASAYLERQNACSPSAHLHSDPAEPSLVLLLLR